MDVFLFQELQRAAHSFKEGNHNGAESVIRSLLAIGDPLVIKHTTHLLQRNVLQLGSEAVYVHFAAVRFLRFFITRHRGLWCENKKKLLHYFFDYVQSNSEYILTPAWRSVVSEAALGAAVTLKLSCGSVEGDVDASSFSEVVSDLISLLESRGSEVQIVFIRHTVLHAVEEFGLHHPASRGRGMPLRFHRACRTLFESDGLARLLNRLLFHAASGIGETFQTVEILLQCLNSLMLWPAHNQSEEGSSEGGYHHYSFRVSGSLWQTLLLEGVSLPEMTVTVDSLLRSWYSNGCISGFEFNRVTLVELIRQFCGVTMESWSFLDKVGYGERFLYLACFVAKNLLESVKRKHEDARAMLPLAIAGIRTIVENLEEIFTVHKIFSFCVSELLLFLMTLIELDNQFPDDDGIMAALDESLSCLFKISTMTLDHGPLLDLIRFAGVEVLNKFLSINLSCAHLSEEASQFCDAFTASRITLLGHLGRLHPEQTASSICLALEMLYGRYSEMGRHSGPERIQIYEGLWLVLKIVNAFLADACEGELVEAPLCFAGSIMLESHPILKIVSSLMTLIHEIMRGLSEASPAVVSGLLEVWGSFIAVYVATNDEFGVFFAEGVTVAVSCAVHSLRVFNFDEDVALFGCRVLDVSVKSKAMISTLQSCGILQTVEDMITCGQHFYGNVRGRLAAFWVSCISRETFLERHLQVLCSFDIQATEFTSVDVDLCLERCASLSGFFMSLQDGEQLMLCLGVLMTLCDHVLSVSSRRFYEKEVTIRSTELILELFLTSSVTLRGEKVVWMVEKVHTTLGSVIKTLGVDPTWNTESAEEEKHRLLKLLSRLLCEVCRWTMMECDLPQDVVKPLGFTVISTLAAFLTLLDGRCLSFPDFRDSLSLAFQLSAEVFTSEFIAYSESQVFLSTLLFFLSVESVDFQRVGLTVANRVVMCLRDSGSENHDVVVGLLSTILRGFVLGKLSPSLSPDLARSLTTLCSYLSPESIEAALREVVQLCPEPTIVTALHDVMRIVQDHISRDVPLRQMHLRALAEAIADSLSIVEGVLFALF